MTSPNWWFDAMATTPRISGKEVKDITQESVATNKNNATASSHAVVRGNVKRTPDHVKPKKTAVAVFIGLLLYNLGNSFVQLKK